MQQLAVSPGESLQLVSKGSKYKDYWTVKNSAGRQGYVPAAKISLKTTASTTTNVCNAIVKPKTLDRKCAYIELIKDVNDTDGKPFVAPATVFVSHAWKYKFSEPVRA